MMRTESAAVVVAALVALGCSSVRADRLRSHVLAMDEDGFALDPVTRDPIGDRDALRAYIENAFETADDRCDAEWADEHSKSEVTVRRLLLHVHGGMKGTESSLDLAERVLARMDREPYESWAYPIFVTWPSGPLDTYWEHLTLLRQGRKETLIGAISSPLFLLSDFARGIARLPRSLLFQIWTDLDAATDIAFDANLRSSEKNAKTLYPVAKSAGYDLALGRYSRGAWRQAGRLGAYLITWPIKLFVQTLFLDGMGQGAWDSMLHRTRSAFWKPEAFDVGESRHNRAALERTVDLAPNGDLAVLLALLDAHIHAEEERTRDDDRVPDITYELVLVGHSMGAIVVNQALEYLCGDHVSRIVYMAPACSIRDAADAVVPFLQREGNEHVKFHVLTLHPMAEADEVNAFDLTSRGSLLEWIDNWYSVPVMHPDRRLGKWVNLIQAVQLFRDVKHQVSFKGFGALPGSIPRQHGQFNDCPFWREDFWDPAGPLYYYPDEERGTWRAER
jgi:hypothetical protein